MEGIRETKLFAFLYVFVDCFLCVTLLLNQKLFKLSDIFVCFGFLIFSEVLCLASFWVKLLSEFFIVSVLQVATFIVVGYQTGSAAPLFFLPLCFVFTFVSEDSKLKRWILVAGGAWGTYVLFGLKISSFEFIEASGRADELVFCFIISSVFLSLALGNHTKIEKKKLEQLKKETAYLSLQTDELADQNYRDNLTGLPNRRYYDLVLPKLIGVNEDFGTPLSLIVIDIDHFKKINDTYGHAMGDKVLSALGNLINSSIREEDTACRYGGEEFVVLMKADLKTAADRAELIRAKAAGLNPSNIHMTISCGVAQYSKGTNLFSLADKELYRAKELGRNMVCCQ